MITKASPRRAAAPPQTSIPQTLLRIVNTALDDMKAVNVKVMDVRQLTDITDIVVIASGNSDRHVKSIADRVTQLAKQSGFQPIGVEGAREGEWVLVDLNDLVCHVMLPRVREFYGLETLWEDVKPPVAEPVPDAKPRDVEAKPRAAKAKPAGAGKPRAAAKPRSAKPRSAKPRAAKPRAAAVRRKTSSRPRPAR